MKIINFNYLKKIIITNYLNCILLRVFILKRVSHCLEYYSYILRNRMIYIVV